MVRLNRCATTPRAWRVNIRWQSVEMPFATAKVAHFLFRVEEVGHFIQDSIQNRHIPNPGVYIADNDSKYR